MKWVEIKDGLIVAKGESPALAEGQIEVTDEIYDELTNLPANFETDEEGNIISVTPLPPPEPEPLPQPPTLEERVAALEMAILELAGI